MAWLNLPTEEGLSSKRLANQKKLSIFGAFLPYIQLFGIVTHRSSFLLVPNKFQVNDSPASQDHARSLYSKLAAVF